MATNLQLDDQLIEAAVKLGKHRSKKEAVTQALVEYTRRLRQLQILDSFGNVDVAEDYDYKEQRSRV